MPRGDSRHRNPRAYAPETPADGDIPWPEAVLTEEHHGAQVAQALALRLAQAIAARGWSVAKLSRNSGVSRLTIANVLEGQVWPDLLTISRLERALERDLWPGWRV